MLAICSSVYEGVCQCVGFGITLKTTSFSACTVFFFIRTDMSQQIIIKIHCEQYGNYGNS